MGGAAEAVFRGNTVLVTGASSGIGKEFATRAAASGGTVILVARRASALNALAESLRADYGAMVDVLPADLGIPGAAVALRTALDARGHDIDVLINNAGIGVHGDLVEVPPETVTAQIQLNVLTVSELTAALLPAMVARRRGTVINVASTAAFQPVPHMAVYSATKAFVLAFTRALWAETRQSGVRVLALCPGATDTEFFDTAGDAAAVGDRRSPAAVVDTALRAWTHNRPSVVDGRANAVLAGLAPRLPERVVLGLAERSVRPTATTVG
ncbi:hypothetical protein EV589_4096 [Mycobacterium sp. BK558]|nr:hypothetical protein EV589_4096 [Mycobacterium sp. BK558]